MKVLYFSNRQTQVAWGYVSIKVEKLLKNIKLKNIKDLNLEKPKNLNIKN